MGGNSVYDISTVRIYNNIFISLLHVVIIIILTIVQYLLFCEIIFNYLTRENVKFHRDLSDRAAVVKDPLISILQ